MSESTLSLSRDDLLRLTAERCGYEHRANTTEGLSSSEATEIGLYVDEGQRKFFLAYDWSFLRPVVTGTLWSTATGSVSGATATVGGTLSSASYDSASGLTTMTATASVFVSEMVGLNYVDSASYEIVKYLNSLQVQVNGDASAETGAFTISGLSQVTATVAKFFAEMEGATFTYDTSSTGYTILSYQSTTVLYLEGTATGETSGDTFTITATGSYRLPDNFGGLMGDVWFGLNVGSYRPLKNCGVAELMELLQATSSPSRPTKVAEEWLVLGNTGQRANFLVWTIPDTNYPIKYQMMILPEALVLGNYPYGTAQHAETLKYACFAARELSKTHGHGSDNTEFNRLLGFSVRRDRKHGPRSLGILKNANPYYRGRDSRRYRSNRVSYNGTFYP